MRKGLLVLMIGCFLLGMATKAEVEGVKESNLDSRNQGTENYVKKVIIDAEWGDDIGEFGMDLHSSPPSGPGNLVVDKENLYIYDWANSRICKYNLMGDFKKILDVDEEEKIVNFSVKNDTLYGVVFPGLSKVEKIKLIDTKTNKEIKMLEIKLPEPHSILDVRKSNGVIVFTSGAGEEEKRYSLGQVSKKEKAIDLSTSRMPKVSERFTKIDEAKGELIVDGQKFLISNFRGEFLLSAKKLRVDRNGNMYISVWSENEVGSSDTRIFEEVFKYSSTGKLLANVFLPKDKIVSVGLAIGDNGDVYYLYATGEIIQEGWDLKFIPGKVQVIKWEL